MMKFSAGYVQHLQEVLKYFPLCFFPQLLELFFLEISKLSFEFLQNESHLCFKMLLPSSLQFSYIPHDGPCQPEENFI